MRGCAPDPVREAPVREGAHKAAIGIGETGRNASAPASGPSANGSQPLSGAECRRTAAKSNPGAPPGSDPILGVPHPPCGAPRARGCAPDPVRVAPVREGAHKAAIGIGETGRNASAPANGPSANGSQPPPDPVREAPVREGAHKAAIDIRETGRNASAPANGPAANGSQPHPVAGCLRTAINAGLHAPTRSHPQWGPCSALRCVHLARIRDEVS